MTIFFFLKNKIKSIFRKISLQLKFIKKIFYFDRKGVMVQILQR